MSPVSFINLYNMSMVSMVRGRSGVPFVVKYGSLIYPVKVSSCLYKASVVEGATIIYPDFPAEKSAQLCEVGNTWCSLFDAQSLLVQVKQFQVR